MGLYITLRIFIVLPSAFTFGIARDGSLNELSSSEPRQWGEKKRREAWKLGKEEQKRNSGFSNQLISSTAIQK